MAPDPSAFSLSGFVLLCTYLAYLCSTPPNPTPYDSKIPDSMGAAVTPLALFIRRSIDVSLGIYHTFLILTYPSPVRTHPILRLIFSPGLPTASSALQLSF